MITASAAVADDSTARVAIYLPNGRDDHQRPGAGNEDRHRRGAGHRARARWRAAAARRRHPDRPARRGGARDPGGVHAGSDPDDDAGCSCSRPPVRRSTCPRIILPTVARRRRSVQRKIVFCLAPPDIPPASGGATFGAKFLSAKLTLNAVVQAVPAGVFLTFWTPWQAGNGQINAAGTVASPAAVAPGAVSITARRVGLGARGGGSGHPGRLGTRRRQGRDLGRREEDRTAQARDGHDEGERHVLAEDADAGRSSRRAPQPRRLPPRRSAPRSRRVSAVSRASTRRSTRSRGRPRRSARSSARGGRGPAPGPRRPLG